MSKQKLTPEQEAIVRKDFEERAFSQYFISSISKKGSGQFSFNVPDDIKDIFQFTKRNDEGDYEEVGLNYAWWAWLECRSFYNITTPEV